MQRTELFRVARRAAPIVLMLLASILAASLAASRVAAAEDWAAFLDALRARGYEDLESAYLKQLQDSGQAPPELNAELDYRIGESAFKDGISATGQRREQLFDEALGALEKYLEAAPDGSFALEAHSGIARIAAEREDLLLREANRPGVGDAIRDEKLAKARQLGSTAREHFGAAGKLSSSRLKKFRESGSASAVEERNAQATHLDLLIRYATAQAQTARAYPKNSDEYKKGLVGAAERFDKIYTTYQKYAGAYRARLSEARIDHELGDDDAALEILSEIGVLPLTEEFYALKTLALALSAEISDSRDDPAALMTLYQKFLEWTEAKLPDEYYRSAEGRQIYYLVAKALVRLEKTRREDYDRYAAAGKKAFVDSDDAGYKEFNVGSKKSEKKLLNLAIKTIYDAGEGTSDEAVAARELLKDEIFQGIDLTKYSFGKKSDGFGDVVAAAGRATSIFSEKQSNYQNAAPEFKEEARREFVGAGEDALRAIQSAIDLSAKEERPDRKAKFSEESRDAAREEVVKLLFREAVVDFALGRYEEAFVAGDAAAREEGFESAAQGAIVALRSLQTILADAKKNGDPEADALEARANEYVAFCNERWGDDDDSPIAQESLAALVESAGAAGDVQGALDALAKIPESSPRRAASEMRLGQLLLAEWSRRSASRKDSAADDGAESSDEGDDSEIGRDELLELARRNLYAGLERRLLAADGSLDNDATLIYSAYLLAQACALQGDFANAEKWLDHPRIGALTVANRAAEDSESVPAFVDENFRIRAIALKLRVAANDPSRLDEAMNLVTRLDAIVAESPDKATAADRLASVYLELGRRFEDRLDALARQAAEGDESKRAELDAATAGFAAFLDRVASRGAELDYAEARWLVEEYVALGKGKLGKDGAPTPEADARFAKALALCRQIVANVDDASKPDYAPSGTAKIAVMLKVCEILRYEGKYDAAYKNLKLILSQSPNNVDAQQEAATLLEARGKSDPSYYAKAIAGDGAGANGSRQVWGWNGLIRRLAVAGASDETLKTRYFDACKAKARVRYKYVSSFADPERRKKEALAAAEDVRRLWQKHPEFNGAETVKYFNRAYRSFQKLAGATEIVDLKDSNNRQTVEEPKQ